MDSTSMEDFWCEVASIKESREDGSEEAMLLEFKPADGEHMNITYSSYPGFASSPEEPSLCHSVWAEVLVWMYDHCSSSSEHHS